MIAKQDYNLTRDGKAVPADDPAGVSVLVVKDGYISDEDAKKYGIPADGMEEGDAKAAVTRAAEERERQNLATITDPVLRSALESQPRVAQADPAGGRVVMMPTAPESPEAPKPGEPVPSTAADAGATDADSDGNTATPSASDSPASTQSVSPAPNAAPVEAGAADESDSASGNRRRR